LCTKLSRADDKDEHAAEDEEAADSSYLLLRGTVQRYAYSQIITLHFSLPTFVT